MDKKIELLAPVGGFESLIAAVQNGADAVYLGGNTFNARINASNFDEKSLKKAVEYAHVRGVDVYLTLNTLLFDTEFQELTEYLIYINSIGIDAVIIQDLGVVRFLKSIIPNMPLHASTQMTVHNLEGVLELQGLGFERVVLARELSLSEIDYICANSSIDIEVFVHGALCICYSGQCLMSSIIGGRSGNRGLCAQPCRLPYTLESEKDSVKIMKGYLLSPKDLCSIRGIGDIIVSGVKSLKIEGRMKKPEYVATVVRIYRKYIDMYHENKNIVVADQDEDELLQIFNRGGFTNGYFYGKSGSNMMSYEKPSNWGTYVGRVGKYNNTKREIEIILESNLFLGDGIEFWQNDNFEGMRVNKITKNNVQVKSAQKGETVYLNVQEKVSEGIKVYKTSSIELNEKASKSFDRENRRINIRGKIEIKLGSPVSLMVWDNDGNEAKIEGTICSEKAQKVSLTYERLVDQMKKLGDTPFVFEDIEISIENGISIPISEINNIRRSAIEKLMEIRAIKNYKQIDECVLKANLQEIFISENINNKKITKLSVRLNKIIKNINTDIFVDRYYISITEILKNKQKAILFINRLRDSGSEVFLSMPRILRKNMVSLIIDYVNSIGNIDGILTTGIGQKELFNKDIKFATDFAYNIINSQCLDLIAKKGFVSATLSQELKLSQIKHIIKSSKTNVELIVYGRIPLMISEYCPAGSIIGDKNCENKCSLNCKENFFLIDRLENRMPIITDNLTCQSQILNSKILFLGQDIEKVVQNGPDYIRLDFTIEDGNEINNMIKFHRDFLDKGNVVFDGYKNLIDNMKNDFTRGHFFRGVE